MTFGEHDLWELRVLSKMTTDTHKIGIELGLVPIQPLQEALERLQLRDAIRLIDVCPVFCAPGKLMRVFKVMPDAVNWYEKARAEIEAED